MARPSRPKHGNKAFFHALPRILIGSYFMASAAGLITDAAGKAPGLPNDPLHMLGAAFVFIVALLVVLGVKTRAAALLLALYTITTGFALIYTVGMTPSLSVFWRDLALIGGLLMTYSYQPAPRWARRRTKSAAKIQPRRVTRHETGVKPVFQESNVFA